MTKRVEAIVKHEMLIWARENAGLDEKQAAKKAQVTPERLASWEECGGSKPTVNQLRKLGKAYKRPLAFFYLPEPPKDFQAMNDYRRLPGEVAGIESPELRYQIRRAHSRRELALELYEAVEGSPPVFSLRTSISDNHEGLGNSIRKSLGIKYEEQVKWRHAYKALNQWRSAFENAGVLVFQATDVDVTEMRGFSIKDTPFPAIVVNIKDSPTGRIFTMLHELSHIMLRESGLCDLYEESYLSPEKRKVEAFCNSVAGAALVPRDYLLKEDLVGKKSAEFEWSDEEIKMLSERYGVSREVLLRRLLILGRTTERFYKQKRKQLQEEYERRRKPQKGGYPSPSTLAISSAGRLFVRLVLSNLYQDKITLSDVSDFLGVRLKHLSKIETELIKGPVRFQAAL